MGQRLAISIIGKARLGDEQPSTGNTSANRQEHDFYRQSLPYFMFSLQEREILDLSVGLSQITI